MPADTTEGIGQTVPIEPLECRLDVSLLGIVEDRLAPTQERRHLISTTLTGHSDHAATGMSGACCSVWLTLGRRAETEVDDVGAKRVQCAVGLVTDVEETLEDRLAETVHRGAPRANDVVTTVIEHAERVVQDLGQIPAHPAQRVGRVDTHLADLLLDVIGGPTSGGEHLLPHRVPVLGPLVVTALEILSVLLGRLGLMDRNLGAGGATEHTGLAL